MLHKSREEKTSLSLHVLYLKGFTTYNKSNGWSSGDRILKVFANYLQFEFSECKVFRIFGDDFVILQNEYQEIDIDKINALEFLKMAHLVCKHDKFDIERQNITSYKELHKPL